MRFIMRRFQQEISPVDAKPRAGNAIGKGQQRDARKVRRRRAAHIGKYRLAANAEVQHPATTLRREIQGHSATPQTKHGAARWR
jgi:hypothetical protein